VGGWGGESDHYPDRESNDKSLHMQLFYSSSILLIVLVTDTWLPQALALLIYGHHYHRHHQQFHERYCHYHHRSLISTGENHAKSELGPGIQTWKVAAQTLRASKLYGTDIKDIICESVDDNLHCWRLFDQTDREKSVFLKTMPKPGVSLQTEVKALAAFSKYTPGITPRVLYIDPDPDPATCFVLFEFLEGFEHLSHVELRGEVNADLGRVVGTVMGRSHARSHVCFSR
jgi:hypothetical protein